MQRDPSIEVVGTAMDGSIGLKKIEELHPSVVTLDLDMPRMDGLEMLRQITRRFHIPVIIVSAHTAHGASLTLKALALGAFDFVTKPQEAAAGRLDQIATELALKIKVAHSSGAPKMIITEPAGKADCSGQEHDAAALAFAHRRHRRFHRRPASAAISFHAASRGFPRLPADRPAHARRFYGNVLAAPE